eukprot:496065-Amphidinium_carterae.1
MEHLSITVSNDLRIDHLPILEISLRWWLLRVVHGTHGLAGRLLLGHVPKQHTKIAEERSTSSWSSFGHNLDGVNPRGATVINQLLASGCSAPMRLLRVCLF